MTDPKTLAEQVVLRFRLMSDKRTSDRAPDEFALAAIEASRAEVVQLIEEKRDKEAGALCFTDADVAVYNARLAVLNELLAELALSKTPNP
jgi:hypothetical protein